MGSSLRKPVTSVPITRRCGERFCVGMAEMNGFRNSMEDSHVIHMVDNWGFFGVFDGHGGSQCSSYIAGRVQEELQKSGLPKDDADVRALVFRLDQEFLDQDAGRSGSTGTFAIIEAPETSDDLHTIRVGNIGDSRVLLGRYDGTMVEGFGTDGALTTDHKPNNDIEKARIEKARGFVKEAGGGVHRVNGELAVSRAFGDSHLKKCDGLHEDGGRLHPEDRIVSVEPEFCTVQAEPSNFLLLVCDGISEGEFPNREVVALASQELCQHGDPGRAAIAVCRRALVKDSRDNLTCMVVLLRGDSDNSLRQFPEDELIPGEFWDMLSDPKFKDAYEMMSIRGGSTLVECVERRFDRARQDLGTLEVLHACEITAEDRKAAQDIFVWNPEVGHDVSIEQKIKSLQNEIMVFGDRPPDPGSEDRSAWFQEYVNSRAALDSFQLSEQLSAGKPKLSSRLEEQLASIMREELKARNQALDSDLDAQEDDSDLTTEPDLTTKPDSDEVALLTTILQDAREATPSLDETIAVDTIHTSENRLVTEIRVTRDENSLKRAFEAHPGITWSDRLVEVCGKRGIALQVDSDGTSQIRFEAPLSFIAWLPNSVLSPCLRVQDSVKVAKLEDLMKSFERREVPWDEKLEVTCDKDGRIVEMDDEDGTACVQFDGRKAAWLPVDALTLC